MAPAGRPPWALALVLAACAAVNWGVLRARPLHAAAEADAAQRAELERALAALPPPRDPQALEAEVTAAEDARRALEARAAALAARVAAPAERPALELHLARLAEEARLRVERQEPARGPAAAAGARTWTLRGTFRGVRQLLGQLARLERRVLVTDLTLEVDPRARPGQDGLLLVRLTVAP